MKKIGILLVITTAILLTGCVSLKTPIDRPGLEPTLAVLDYEVVGPVTVEGDSTNIMGLFWFGGASYSDLLKAAQDMGADDVINVYDDAETSTVLGIYNKFKITWTGTAIKYKGTITE